MKRSPACVHALARRCLILLRHEELISIAFLSQKPDYPNRPCLPLLRNGCGLVGLIGRHKKGPYLSVGIGITMILRSR